MFFVWHQLSRIFTWVVLGCDANNSRLTSHITEHKKKSEPFAYRLWVRISTVWCGQEDLNPYGVIHTPLKRARLPVPPLPRADIDNWYYTISFPRCQAAD